jgi:hypothetical protein
MGLLRIIAIFLIIFFLVRFLGRLFAPILNPNRGEGPRSNARDNRREGDVTIEYTDKQKSSGSKGDKGGEYIDFEEVDD